MKFLASTLIALISAISSVAAFAPASLRTTATSRAASIVAPVAATASSEEYYIDDERRFVMNLIMFGSIAVNVGAFGIPFLLFFVPPGSGSGSGGVVAKDALGNDIFAKAYLETKPAGDRSLAQGLKGDAT